MFLLFSVNVSLSLSLSCSFYLQPGSPNPVVKLFVVDTDNVSEITEVAVPDAFKLR